MKPRKAAGNQHVAAQEDDVRLLRQAMGLLLPALLEIEIDDERRHDGADDQGQQVEGRRQQGDVEHVRHIAGAQKLECLRERADRRAAQHGKRQALEDQHARQRDDKGRNPVIGDEIALHPANGSAEREAGRW